MKFWLKLACLLILIGIVNCPTGVKGGVYNLHLTTDNVPDYTNIDSFVHSTTGHLSTPQEKCIAVWRWGRRSRRQTSNSTEDGRLVLDPILHYNSYGTMNCGVISGLNMASWLKLGYKARYIQLGDHTVSEVSWDDGVSWHLFDSSMSFFCYNDKGVIASCEEIKAAHGGTFSGGVDEPGYYYYYHGAPQCISHPGKDGWRYCSDNPVAYERTLGNGAMSYTDGYSVDKYTLHVRHGHRYILNLLPGQSYTRYWSPIDRFTAGVDTRDYYRPVKDKDPDEHHNLHNIRGNGIWLFEPDLRRVDCLDLLYDYESIRTNSGTRTNPAIYPTKRQKLAHGVFKVSAANVITSLRITGKGLCTQTDDILRILVSRNAGISWQSVWQSNESGSLLIDVSLRDEVAGVTECLVKVEMLASKTATDVGLNQFKLTTVIQLNRRTLPKLTLGSNQIRLSADRQTETTVLWPPLHSDQYKQTALSSQDVYCTEQPDGMYKATLGAGKNNSPGEVVWQVTVPTDISHVIYSAVVTNKSPNDYVSLHYSNDGSHFTEFYRKANGDAPFDDQVSYAYSNEQIPSHTRHAFFKAIFFSKSGAAKYTMAGLQDVLMQIEHRPRNAEFVPIEITYNWTEHRTSGDVVRSHSELVNSLNHVYTLNVAGRRDPTMNWIRMNLKDSHSGQGPVLYGYSDGEDVGDVCEPESRLFVWGDNLALGKAYTTSRKSSDISRNPDTAGAELTNGKVIAPTDYVYSKTVQAATAFWESGEPVTTVVDLGQEQTLGGVRICTHQPNDRYGHPQQIDVALSTDGIGWQSAGTIEHDDLWKPPADYEPWEHDDNPKYDTLPAGGRLAYRYPLAFSKPQVGRYIRIVCTAQQSCGLGISEIEIYNDAKVLSAPALIAPLENR